MKLWRSRPAVAPADTTTLPVPVAPGDVGPVGGDGQAAPAPAGEMPFLDHLEELRWHIFKAVGGVAAACVLCFVFAQWIIDKVLLAQTHASYFMYPYLGIDAIDVTLQNRSITGQFFAYYGTVLAAAVVVGSPVIVYQIWKFIEPGLYPNEKKGVRFAAFFATFFFALGIAFGYFILSPYALQYFASFIISSTIVNEFDITKYFSMLLGWTFGSGVLFELPVVVFVLARIGIVTAAMLRASRKFALVIILVLSAVFTPPDPLSMMIMAFPLLMLYELSILLTVFVERAKRKEALRAEAAAAVAVAAGVVVVAESPGDVPPVSRPE